MKFTSLLFCAALGSLAAIESGCASITRGTHDTLVVESDPAGARVHLSSGQSGMTPTSFKLPRKKDVDVHIEKDGYEPVDSHITAQISGKGAAGMAGNVLVGGLIGVGVDAYTGATKDLRPNPLHVKLVPLKPTATTGASSSGTITANPAPAPIAPPPPKPISEAAALAPSTGEKRG